MVGNLFVAEGQWSWPLQFSGLGSPTSTVLGNLATLPRGFTHGERLQPGHRPGVTVGEEGRETWAQDGAIHVVELKQQFAVGQEPERNGTRADAIRADPKRV